MKSAEEILSVSGVFMTDFISSSGYAGAIQAVNEARKEAIEECASKVGRYSYDMGRTEILALKNKLK